MEGAGRILPVRSRAWLCGIVLIAAALRFVPIWFGLPHLRTRPDEETAVGLATAMLQGDLNPRFFHWPSLTFYIFAGAFTVTSWIRRALSLDPELTAAGYHVLARGLVAFAGTATVAVTYRIGRRVADTTTGLFAALFLAVALLHVRESHFAMTDVLMTLLVTGSLGLLLRAVDVEQRPGAGALWWFAAAGLAGGFAASTKYSAAAIFAAMGAAQLLLLNNGAPLRLRTWLPSVAFATAFGAAFVLGTPYAVLDFKTFDEHLRFTMTHLSQGHGVDLGRGWSYHVKRSLPYGVGILTFATGLAGVVPFARHHPRAAAIVGAFAAGFYLSIGSGQTVFFRYVLPLVPIVCLSAAIFVRHAAPWLASRTRLPSSAAAGFLAALIALPSAVNCVWFDVLLAKTDTRVLAARYLEKRLTPDSTLHDAGGAYSELDLSRARFHQWYFDPATKSFGHPAAVTPDWLIIHDSPLKVYGQSPWELRNLARQKYALVEVFPGTRRGGRAAVYDQQDAFFLPFSRFGTVERPGPTISIYRLLTP